MKKILVPCDFSKPAINAYRFALDLAHLSGGTVHLLNVIELPAVYDSILMPVLNFEEQLFKDLEAKTDKEFNKIINKYKVDSVKVVTKMQFGVVAKTLMDYIADQSIDLVVMGSHGASGLKEIFIGSNAEKMVRYSPVPVLVLKKYSKGPIKHIVFPNTLETEHQEDLIMKVKQLQSFFRAKLHIVWINTPLNFTSDTVTIKRLNEFAERFLLKDYTINVYNYSSEEEGILQFYQEIKGDLIAMGTHARKGISHLVNGSLAEDIVNHTDKLVWTYTLKNEPVELDA